MPHRAFCVVCWFTRGWLRGCIRTTRLFRLLPRYAPRTRLRFGLPATPALLHTAVLLVLPGCLPPWLLVPVYNLPDPVPGLRFYALPTPHTFTTLPLLRSAHTHTATRLPRGYALRGSHGWVVRLPYLPQFTTHTFPGSFHFTTPHTAGCLFCRITVITGFQFLRLRFTHLYIGLRTVYVYHCRYTHTRLLPGSLRFGLRAWFGWIAVGSFRFARCTVGYAVLPRTTCGSCGSAVHAFTHTRLRYTTRFTHHAAARLVTFVYAGLRIHHVPRLVTFWLRLRLYYAILRLPHVRFLVTVTHRLHHTVTGLIWLVLRYRLRLRSHTVHYLPFTHGYVTAAVVVRTFPTVYVHADSLHTRLPLVGYHGSHHAFYRAHTRLPRLVYTAVLRLPALPFAVLVYTFLHICRLRLPFTVHGLRCHVYGLRSVTLLAFIYAFTHGYTAFSLVHCLQFLRAFTHCWFTVLRFWFCVLRCRGSHRVRYVYLRFAARTFTVTVAHAVVTDFTPHVLRFSSAFPVRGCTHFATHGYSLDYRSTWFAHTVWVTHGCAAFYTHAPYGYHGFTYAVHCTRQFNRYTLRFTRGSVYTRSPQFCVYTPHSSHRLVLPHSVTHCGCYTVTHTHTRLRGWLFYGCYAPGWLRSTLRAFVRLYYGYVTFGCGCCGCVLAVTVGWLVTGCRFRLLRFYVGCLQFHTHTGCLWLRLRLHCCTF